MTADLTAVHADGAGVFLHAGLPDRRGEETTHKCDARCPAMSGDSTHPGGWSCSGRCNSGTCSARCRPSARSGRPGPGPRSCWSGSPGAGVRRPLRSHPRRLPRVPRLSGPARTRAGDRRDPRIPGRDPGGALRPRRAAPRQRTDRQSAGEPVRGAPGRGVLSSERALPRPGDVPSLARRGLEIHRLLALPEFLGFPAVGDHLEFPIREADRSALALIVGERPPQSGHYICIHTGASVPGRRWPVGHFAAVVAAMAAHEFEIVLTGTAAEGGLTREVAERSGASCLDLAGRTDLGSLAAMLEGARLLVCNDTGVSHLAAALGVPSVVISTGDNPALGTDRPGAASRPLPAGGRPAGGRPARGRGGAPGLPPREGLLMRRLRVLTWHVHGNYLLYLSQGRVNFFLPVRTVGAGGYGGRGTTFPFGDNVHDMPVELVREQTFDLILYQERTNYEVGRHEILSPAQRRLPRIYLEHDPPLANPTDQKHWFDDPDGLLVHVTPFNALMWDSGRTPTRVIEHGVLVPEHVRYTGEIREGSRRSTTCGRGAVGSGRTCSSGSVARCRSTWSAWTRSRSAGWARSRRPSCRPSRRGIASSSTRSDGPASGWR